MKSSVRGRVAEELVLDASAAVDLLTESPHAPSIALRIADAELHAPAHFHAEVLSAFGRMTRARVLTQDEVATKLALLVALPINLIPVESLLLAAWNRRNQLHLADALYVEVAARLDTVVITTDQRLARATPLAEAPGS